MTYIVGILQIRPTVGRCERVVGHQPLAVRTGQSIDEHTIRFGSGVGGDRRCVWCCGSEGRTIDLQRILEGTSSLQFQTAVDECPIPPEWPCCARSVPVARRVRSHIRALEGPTSSNRFVIVAICAT